MRYLPIFFSFLLPALPVAAAEPLAFPINEAPFAARLVNIDREWNVHLRTGDKVRVVDANDLAYWGRFRDVESGPQILLTDGSVLRADVLSLEDQQLVLGDATGLGRGQWDESTLPRAAVQAILFQPPADAAERDALLQLLQEANEPEDRLLLVGGESVSGTLAAAPLAGRFTPEGLKPGSEAFLLARRNVAEPLSIPAGKVVAASFAAVGVSPRSSAAGNVWLGFEGGSLVLTRSIDVKGDAVSISPAAGGALLTTLSGRGDPDKKLWDAITLVQPAASRVRWLSDQRPVGYKHIPFISISRPLGSDRSVLGSRLRADGAVFLKGLGMPSASRVAYDVAGYRRFEAELAIDEAAGLKGSVIFKVLLEGEPNQWRPAYESAIIRGGETPVPISIDLKGATRMALIVDFADRADECDWADWLNARLTK